MNKILKYLFTPFVSRIEKYSTDILAIVFAFIAFSTQAQSLTFTQNNRQWNEEVLYKCTIGTDQIYIQKNGILFNINSKEDIQVAHENGEENENSNDFIRAHAYIVTPLNANINSEIIAESPTDYYSNYFIGNNSSNWASNVYSYRKLIQKNIYPNIDWAIYSEAANFKYDFIVHPTADYHQIELAYKGIDNLKINDGGNLEITTSIRTITELKPYAYQIINHKKIEIPCTYILKNNCVSYALDAYNEQYDLIIDPIIIMGTYSGARDQTIANCSAFDTLNNMYSSGIAINGLYPTTIGAYRTSYAGMGDIVISKYNSLGTTQLFATYIGGYLRDHPASIIIDKTNRILVCGHTMSPDYPITTGIIDSIFNGDTINRDAFISILNNNGTALLHSTFIGGRYDEEITDIKLDDTLNIYVCGFTNSDNFTTTPGVYDNTYNGNYDAFLCKTNSTLSILKTATYLGTNLAESGYGLTLDKLNNIYLMGKTYSNAFPTSTSAVSRTYRGAGDGFITRFDNNFQLLASTYVSSTLLDYAKMAIHDSGLVYVLAYTDGNVSRFPSCKASTGFGGAFLSCYKENLDSLVYRIPITNYDVATNITAFELSDSNYFLISSFVNLIRSTFPDSIYTTDSTHRIRNKSLYFLCISKNGEDIYNASLINSYFGGHMHGYNCRFNKKNNRLFHVICSSGGEVATSTAPSRFPLTMGEYDMYSFIYQPTISTATSYLPNMRISDSLLCSRGYIQLINTSIGINSFKWLLPNGTSDSINNSLNFRNVVDGTNIIKLIVKRNCSTIDTLIDTVYTSRKPQGMAIRLNDSINCLGNTINCTDSIIAGNRSIWKLPTAIIDSTHDTIRFTPTTTGLQTFLLVTDSMECPYRKDTLKVNYYIYDQAHASIVNIDTPICIPYSDSIRQNSTFYNHFIWWDDLGNFDSIHSSFYLNINSVVDYNVYLQVANSYCNNSSIDTIRIKSVAPPIASITASQLTGCINNTLTFTNTSSNFTNYYWLLNDSIIDSTNMSISMLFTHAGNYSIKLITKTFHCTATDTQELNITIHPLPLSVIDTVVLTGCSPFNTSLYNHSLNSNLFYWILPDMSIDSLHDTLSILQNIAGDYEYQLIVFGDSCNSLSDTSKIMIHVFDAAESMINIGDTAICNSYNLFIENWSSHATNYLWLINDSIAPLSQDSFYLNFTAPTNYQITLLSWNLVCPDKVDTLVTNIAIMDKPTAAAAISSIVGCPPMTITFTNNSSNYDSLFWLINDSIVSTNNLFSYLFTTSGNYTVQTIAMNTNCMVYDTSISQIQILHPPLAAITIYDTALCIPDTALLINSSTYASSYYWITSSIDSINNPFLYSEIDSGLYTITLVVQGSECPLLTDTSIQYVYFKPPATISLLLEDTSGCSPLYTRAFLSVAHTNNKWSSIPFSNTFFNYDTVGYHFSDVGYHTIQVSIYDSICIESPQIIQRNIEVYPQSIAAFYYTPTYLEADSFTTFISNAAFFDTITWYIDDTIQYSNTDSIQLNPLYAGTHQICLTTTNSYNCNDTSCQTIYVLEKPKTISPCIINPVTAFSPNNDGINDQFFVLAKTAENIDVKVFNRWGEQVYNSHSNYDFNIRNDYWDGIYKGREQLMGTYTYIITATCPLNKERMLKTGTVTLIR